MKAIKSIKTDEEIIDKRVSSYPGVFVKHNYKTMVCVFCRKVVDHIRKSTITDHIACPTHVSNSFKHIQTSVNFTSNDTVIEDFIKVKFVFQFFKFYKIFI